jgi:hypothetical protein
MTIDMTQLRWLRVLVLADSSGYIAQGLDVDYVACGDTQAKAVDNFELGLQDTLKLQLQRYGYLTCQLPLPLVELPNNTYQLAFVCQSDAIQPTLRQLGYPGVAYYRPATWLEKRAPWVISLLTAAHLAWLVCQDFVLSLVGK